MTGETTSPVTGESRAIAPPNSVRGEWLRFAGFLRRPYLPEDIAPTSVAVAGTARMIALDLIIMGTIIAVLMTLVSFGVELPDNLNASLDLTPGIIALIVIVAPVLEELVFRSWLSGRPAHVFAIVAFAGIGFLTTAGLGIAGFDFADDALSNGLAAFALGIFAGLIAAVVAFFGLRSRPALTLFKAHFRVFFWFSAAGFALIHLANYTEGSLIALLPLLLPQFILGVIAAYVRVHYGLWTAIAAHAVHNGFAISLALMAMAAGIDS